MSIFKRVRDICFAGVHECLDKRLMAETTDVIEKRARQAQLAVETEEEHIAKIALQEKLLAEKKLEVYRRQYETIKSQSATLVENLKELKDNYLELENKKRTLISRANVAQSIRNMNTSLITIDTASVAKGFARMEERVFQMEADAESSMRIRQSYGSVDSLKTECSLQDQVEQKFAKLKASASK